VAPAGCGLSARSYAAPRQWLARQIAWWTAWCAQRLAQQRMRFETGPADCQTAHSCIASVDGSRRARRLARRLACGASVEDSIRDGPGALPDSSLAALRRMVRGGPGVLPYGSLVALQQMVRSRRARCLTRRLARQLLHR